MSNSRYLWVCGDDEALIMIVTAGDLAHARKLALKRRAEWVMTGDKPTRSNYREAIGWFNRSDRIFDLDEIVEEISD